MLVQVAGFLQDKPLYRQHRTNKHAVLLKSGSGSNGEELWWMMKLLLASSGSAKKCCRSGSARTGIMLH